MKMADEPVENTSVQDNTPRNAKQLLAQIDSALAKKDLESVKAKATEIKTKIKEAERTIRLLTAELNEIVTKFENGIL